MTDHIQKNQQSSTKSANVKQPVKAEIGSKTSGLESEQCEQEDTSSSGSSDSESESEDEADQLPTDGPQGVDIHQRLTSFFSQLAEQRANPPVDEKIEEDSSDSGFEDENSGKQYVQLDLALGVLSQEDGTGDVVKVPRDEAEDESDASDDDGGQDNLQKLKSLKGAETAKQKKPTSKRKIQELG